MYKLSKQWFPQKLVRFAKQLSFTYLENGFVSYLSSVLEIPLRCLWDVFLRCLINAFVRYYLDLEKSCLLDILETSPQDYLAVLTRELLDILQISFGPLGIKTMLPNWVEYEFKLCIKCVRSMEHVSSLRIIKTV